MLARRTTLVLVLSALASSREARAEWYGAGMIVADAGSWALTFGGVVSDSPAVAITGLGVGIVGGPLFHLARKNYGRMGASLGLRLGGPLIGFAMGNAGGSDPASARRHRPHARSRRRISSSTCVSSRTFTGLVR